MMPMVDPGFKFAKVDPEGHKYLGPKGIVSAYQVIVTTTGYVGTWPNRTCLGKMTRDIGIVYRAKDGLWRPAVLFSFVAKGMRTGARYEYLPYTAATRAEAATFLYARVVK